MAKQKTKCSVIFRPYRKDKNGKVLYAKDYGYKAWRILLKDK